MLRQRVNDGRILRLIGKWLQAGVMEEGERSHPETVVVQGGVILPVLAYVFRHHVLDAWCAREVRPCMKGRCFLLRFADDCAPQTHERGLNHVRMREPPSMRCCTGDEGRPLGAVWQEEAPNPLNRRWSKARVVSVEEKAG